MAGSMNWIRRWYEIAAAVPVVVGFAALYLWSIPAEGPERLETMIWIAALFVMPTMLWLITSWLLVDQWWGGTGARLSTMDAPGRLLATTVATMPEPRRRWGEAMLGELAQVQGRSARWRFALSCARAALVLPLPTRRPVLAIIAGLVVAAVVVTHTMASGAVPGFGLFAASFVALVGVTVVLTIARARRVRLPVPAATVLVTGAVAASITALVVLLLQHPTAAEGLLPARAVLLAVAFAGCLWLAVAPPRRLGSSRLAPHLGVAGAVVLILGILAASFADIEGLLPFLLLFGPWAAFGVPAGISAAMGRSFRTGLQAGIWTAIAIMPLSWTLSLAMMLREYAVDGRFTFAGDLTSAGFNLGFAFMTFMAIPIIGFPFAALGAITGAALRGTPPARSSGPDETSPPSPVTAPSP